MNAKYILLSLAAGSSLALAAEPPAENYAYGMALDIASIVSISEPQGVCGVVPAVLTYRDSQGELHTLEYRKWSTGCGIFDDGGLNATSG